MPRIKEKLTVTQIRNLKQPGRYNDGSGLYLLINHQGRRYWIFRYRDRVTGKLRDRGLGPLEDVTLKRAREKATDCRNDLRDGIDPIDRIKQAKIEEKIAHSRRMTFKDCATRYIEAHRAGWRNAKHAAQWTATLNTYCASLMPLPVAEIDTALVISCLEPIWTEKTETASRVRQRIECVLAWATVREFRRGENPARWRGHLDESLPKPSKVKSVKHRPAVDYRQLGELMREIRAVNSLAASALELQILTATRPGEVVGARWVEFDSKNKKWTIPAERMKANKEHEIPLSPQAVSLLKSLSHLSDFVFPGVAPGRHLTTAAGMKLLKDLRPGITAHGFRSTFRDWAGESTAHPREVIEMAMAHQLKDKAEAAYARGRLLEKRTRLMADWANYCDLESMPEASVTPIRVGKNVILLAE